MAARKTTTVSAETTQTSAPAAPAVTATVPGQKPQKTVSGYSIGVFAFIPVAPGDLRKQSEVPLLLLDIQEGRKTVADLAPYLKQVEFRQQHNRKRVTDEEYNALFSEPQAEEKVETVETVKAAETVEDSAGEVESPEIPWDGDVAEETSDAADESSDGAAEAE